MRVRVFHLFSAIVVIYHGFRLWLLHSCDRFSGPYITIFMVADTLLLAFLPATQLYKHYIRKDRELSVNESDIASWILKVKIWATIIYSTAHCVYSVLPKKNATAREFTILTLASLVIVFADTLMSMWTYLMLVYALASQSPSAVKLYTDFFHNNWTCIRCLGFRKLTLALLDAAALDLEVVPDPKVLTDPEAVPESKAVPDSKAVAVPDHVALDSKV